MQTVTVHPKYNKFNRKFNDDVAVVSVVLPKEKFNQKHALRLCTSSDPVGVQLLMVGFGPAGHPHLSEEVGTRPEVLQETSLMEPKNPTAQGCGKDFDVKRQICFTHRHGREGDSGENIRFFLLRPLNVLRNISLGCVLKQIKFYRFEWCFCEKKFFQAERNKHIEKN